MSTYGTTSVSTDERIAESYAAWVAHDYDADALPPALALPVEVMEWDEAEKVAASAFDEDAHPRGPGGLFVEKDDGDGGGVAVSDGVLLHTDHRGRRTYEFSNEEAVTRGMATIAPGTMKVEVRFPEEAEAEKKGWWQPGDPRVREMAEAALAVDDTRIRSIDLSEARRGANGWTTEGHPYDIAIHRDAARLGRTGEEWWEQNHPDISVIEEVVWHEAGHLRAYQDERGFKEIERDVRAAVQAAYGDDGPPTDEMSPYGRSNIGEGLAEAHVAWVASGYDLAALPPAMATYIVGAGWA
jgi:hypothetical protein